VATEKTQNVQDVFLNHVRKNKTAVTVFLVNGVKLQGIITWFDNFSVLLRRDGHTQLVYKHAISTVMPGAPISFRNQHYLNAGLGVLALVLIVLFLPKGIWDPARFRQLFDHWFRRGTPKA